MFGLLSSATGVVNFNLIGISSLARKCVPLTSSNCGVVSIRLNDIISWLNTL